MEIEKVAALSKVKKAASVSAVKDTVAIKAPDISRFVEELKAMPEIRPEKVDTLREEPTLDQLAQAILDAS
ncbi:MAG: hypothetical protein S4CHLAM81_05860 [Chlamydiales bacterium]|nr:hypothetical protein [Chlamydiales bacterium]MCH9635371.1 hypothetical protein [Chlamydiales bacterium]